MDKQGIDPKRYSVVPRTLVFVRRGNKVLLMRRAPGAQTWPGRLNGVGGHVEAGEDLLMSARREVLEETGLQVSRLRIAGLLHISAPAADKGVLVVVLAAEAAVVPGAVAADQMVGSADSSDETGVIRSPVDSGEGSLHWMDLAEISAEAEDLVPDLPAILPRLWPEDSVLPFVAYSTMGSEGDICFVDYD